MHIITLMVIVKRPVINYSDLTFFNLMFCFHWFFLLFKSMHYTNLKWNAFITTFIFCSLRGIRYQVVGRRCLVNSTSSHTSNTFFSLSFFLPLFPSFFLSFSSFATAVDGYVTIADYAKHQNY